MEDDVTNQMFEEQTPYDAESLFSPIAQGTGNETTDRYLAQKLALMNPDSAEYVFRAQATLDYIQSVDPEEVNSAVEAAIATMRQANADLRLDVAATDQVVGTPVLEPSEQVDLVQNEEIPPSKYEQLAQVGLEYIKKFPVGSAEYWTLRKEVLSMLVTARMEELGIDLDVGIDDVGGLLIPGRNLLDLGAGGDFEKQVAWFNTLKIDDQFREWVNVLDTIVKGTDNDAMRLDRIAPFIDPDDIAEVKKALLYDVFDVATIAPFGKILKLAKHSHTPVKILKDAGKAEEAADILNAATKNAEAAKAAGMTQQDAVLSTSPFSKEGIDPRLVEGLSAEAQARILKELEAQAEELRPLHDDTLIKNRVWRPDEVDAAMAKHRRKFAGLVRPLRTDEDGVLWEVGVIKKNDVLQSANTLNDRIEKLRLRMTQLTDIDLPTMQANNATEEVKALKKEIVLTKKELANLEEIRRLDIERDSLTVRLTRSRANNPEDALNGEAKGIVEQLVKIKQQRGRIASRLQQRVVETPEIETKYVKFTEDDFGNLTATEIGDFQSRLINSPSSYIASMEKGLVSTARNIGFTQEYVRGIFQTNYASALQKIGRRSRKKLDAILMQGDESKVVYTADDLVTGVRTPDGVIKLDTEEELAAYFRIRKLSDDLKVFNDRLVRRKLELQNFKAIDLPDGVGYVRETAPLPAIPSDVKRIFDLSTGKVRGRKKLLPGEQVYRLRKPMSREAEDIEYVIAKESDLKPIPHSPLEYNPGYIPRIRNNIHYIGEVVTKRMVNGVLDSNYRKTARFFDNPADAETWRKEMHSKGATVEIKNSNQWFEENPGRIDNWEEQAFGGTFEGSRTDGKIPFNLSGTEAERMGALESLEAYMNYVSNRMPASAFRVALVKRFINSARDPVTGKSVLNRSGDWRDPINLDKSSPVYDGLVAMQEWVKAQLAVPTTEERMWNRLAFSVGRFVGNTSLPMADRISAGIVKAGTSDVSGLAKTLAFHTTLGFFNPAQFIVQGMGFATALALDPVGAPRRLARYLAFRAALLNKNELLLTRAAEAAGESVDEFKVMMEAYYRTGLHQSVESTAEYGIHTGMYASRASIRYVADKGLVFFREGERFVRGYAWMQAWDKMYVKGMKITDEFINAVTNEATRYTLDLNRANRAYWQSGLLGIPTQFMQITTKFIENFAYKGERLEGGWSKAEKARIALGNIAMFGAAGIPLGDTILNSALEYVRSEEEGGLAIKNEGLVTALAGGLTEWGLWIGTGESINLAERVAIPNGIEQTFDKLWDQDSTVIEIMAGVFGEVPKRSVQALGNLYNLYGAILTEAAPADYLVAAETANELLSITSGFRNYRKAFLWERANALLTSTGDPILSLDQRNKNAILIAQGLGLTPGALDDYYKLKKYNQDVEKDVRESTDAWVGLVRKYQNSPILLTPSGSSRVAAQIRFILSDLNQAQRTEVAKRVTKELSKNEYALVKQILEAAENQVKTGNTAPLETNVLLIPKEE